MQASWFSKSKIKSKKLKIGLGLDVSVRLAGYDLMITHSSHGLGFLLFHFSWPSGKKSEENLI